MGDALCKLLALIRVKVVIYIEGAFKTERYRVEAGADFLTIKQCWGNILYLLGGSLKNYHGTI
jgi:hypothetical protein